VRGQDVAAGSTAAGHLSTAKNAEANRDNRAEIAELDRANTVELSEYAKYVEQGGTDAFTPWDRKNKLSGVAAAPDYRSQAFVAADVADLKALSSSVNVQRENLPRLRQLERILASGLTTGPLTEAMHSTLAWLVSIGAAGKDTVAQVTNAEQFTALTSQMFPTLRGDMPGSQTEMEGAILQAGTARLGATTAGNKLIIQHQLEAIERATAAKSYINKAIRKEGASYIEALDNWNQLMRDGDPSTMPKNFNSNEMTDENLGKAARSGALRAGMILYGRNPDGSLDSSFVLNDDDIAKIKKYGG